MSEFNAISEYSDNIDGKMWTSTKHLWLYKLEIISRNSIDGAKTRHLETTSAGNFNFTVLFALVCKTGIIHVFVL